jgi:hypothetical protein
VVNENLVRAVEEKIQENRRFTIPSLSLHFPLLHKIVPDELCLFLEIVFTLGALVHIHPPIKCIPEFVSPGAKWLMHECNHRLLSSARYEAVPSCIIMEWCLIYHKDDFTVKVMWFSSPHAFLRLEIEGKVSPVLNLIITV